MSSYYGNYSQYLGAQRCCNLKTQGPVGPAGPTGPAAVGPGISFGGVTGTSPGNGVWYDSSNNVLRYTPAKSFIIDHPLKNENYLVHACFCPIRA